MFILKDLPQLKPSYLRSPQSVFLRLSEIQQLTWHLIQAMAQLI